MSSWLLLGQVCMVSTRRRDLLIRFSLLFSSLEKLPGLAAIKVGKIYSPDTALLFGERRCATSQEQLRVKGRRATDWSDRGVDMR